MTIASEITRINNNIASAYTAVNNKGGTLPAIQNSANLATAIDSISGGSTPVINTLNVTPKTSAQTIVAPSGVDGYSPVNVSAVTSSIDANIKAGNIKNGVSILGVTGTYEGSGYTELPSYQVSNNGVASRRSGTLTGNEFSGITSIGYRGMFYSFYYCDNLYGLVDFSSLTSVGNYGLAGCFDYTRIRLKDGNLSALVTVGDNGLSNAGLNVGSGDVLDISALTSIGTSGLAYTFEDSNMLTTVYLTSLTTLGSQSMEFAFRKCIKLKDIYFNSLTTTSFGSYTNQFDNMLYMTGKSETHTLHFPSNLISTISRLTGYPTFGGKSGSVVCAFDLPATS